MGDVTTHGLPFPVGTDRVMDGDDAIQALAEAVDTALMDDTGILTPAAAGFVKSSTLWDDLAGSCRRKSGWVTVAFSITIHSDLDAGDVANQAAVNVPPGWRMPSGLAAHLSTGATGAGAFWYHSGAGGTISLSALANNVLAEATLTMTGQWQV